MNRAGILLPIVDSSSESSSDATIGVLLPILDSSSESGSHATILDSSSESGSDATLLDSSYEPGGDTPNVIRPSALRSRLPLLLLPTLPAPSPSSEPQRCCCFIHPSHQNELGIELLLSALLDLEELLSSVRVDTDPGEAWQWQFHNPWQDFP